MTIKKILQGRFLGHPLHPLVTHLPIGLWLLGLILDVVSVTRPPESWAMQGATWCLIAGTAAAVMAAITGFADWLEIRSDHQAQVPALWHMGMMFPATCIFGIDAFMHFVQRHAG